MKIAYAFRRSTFYPYIERERWALPTGETRTRYLARVRELGFDGIELGVDTVGGLDATESQVKALGEELKAAEVPCVAIRAGGSLCLPNVARRSRQRLEKAVQVAHWLGASIVNTALSAPGRNPALGGTTMGEAVAQNSSRFASQHDFEYTARVLREVAESAGELGISITIEVHQHSLADNSWATLYLLDLTGSPNVFANPDLGNIYWQYDVPEESCEEAILALAPRSKYWHCKNLHRVYIPELDRSVFIRVPLPDGDIDYRFAIEAMHRAGFDGYLAVEGAWAGDQLTADRRSIEYVKSILAELEAS